MRIIKLKSILINELFDRKKENNATLKYGIIKNENCY